MNIETYLKTNTISQNEMNRLIELFKNYGFGVEWNKQKTSDELVSPYAVKEINGKKYSVRIHGYRMFNDGMPMHSFSLHFEDAVLKSEIKEIEKLGNFKSNMYPRAISFDCYLEKHNENDLKYVEYVMNCLFV